MDVANGARESTNRVSSMPAQSIATTDPMKKRPTLLLSDTEEGAIGEAALLETVENQIRDLTPPETRATLERLIALGETRENAVRYIACVLSAEVFEILRSELPFNLARYVGQLNALPELPYDEDEI